jgi:DNA-directed RNA polymerase specialized sigma24 family protein
LSRRNRRPGINGVETLEPAVMAKTNTARLAIAALPGPFRETVLLREAHGVRYHEIAEVTDVPIGTVMSPLAARA